MISIEKPLAEHSNMIALLLVSTALKSLNHHKGRSLLTMLGIIIGIASIISILAIGNGAAKKAKRQILAQGRNYIFIHAGNWLAAGTGGTIAIGHIETRQVGRAATGT